MGSVRRWAWGLTVVSLGAAMVGLAILFLDAVGVVIADPTLTIIDAYWVGRLPFSAVGVGVTVLGATVAIVAGTISTWSTGGSGPRGVTVLATAVAAFWWFLAMLPGPQAVPCDTCAPPGPEPLTFAYSQPEITAVLLLLPAVMVGVTAIGSRRTLEAFPGATVA